MGSTNVISTAVDDCARAFLSLAGILEKPNRFAEQVAAEVILDEFDRFKLWAGNISAHRKGESTPWDEETYSDSESEHSDDDASNPDLQGDTEFKQLYSSIKTAITSLMRISMAIREPALNNDDEDDTASQTSYATSVNATVRAPKLPKEAREKEYYDCPFCFALIAIHTTAAWK
ncbi:hypothetical protein N0V95_005070 [Ascochyta clinopodiicola]|nr:hypothetical protein N0V95_005070 [Ascochyta clinopodiicola]